MKKQKDLNISSIFDIISNNNITLELQIKEETKKLEQEYTNIVLETQINLLTEICEDYNLNFEECKKKYINKNNILCSKNIKKTEEILSKIIINNNTYYYENKENGVVYDINSKIIGILINNKIIIY